MGAGPGRNDPCPCGSGKKYKHCCALKAAQSRLSLGTRLWFALIGLMLLIGAWLALTQLNLR